MARIAAVLSLVLAALVAGALPGRALDYDAAAERSFVRLVNKERAARGLGSVAVKADLVRVARSHTAAMVADGELYHRRNLYEAIRPARRVVGENVGFGSSVEELHELFMASASHRDNVLHGLFTEVGVGVGYDDGGAMYVTLNFARPFGPVTVSSEPRLRPRTVLAPAHRTIRRPPGPEVPRTVALLLKLAALDA